VTDAGGVTTISVTQITDDSDTTAAAGAESEADDILADVGEALGNVAAAMTVLKARQAVAYSASANMMAAAARLQDTDFAASSANLAKFSILNQSAMAMVAQANQAQSAVLAVLQ
jgi:flagellin